MMLVVRVQRVHPRRRSWIEGGVHFPIHCVLVSTVPIWIYDPIYTYNTVFLSLLLTNVSNMKGSPHVVHRVTAIMFGR